MNDVEKMDAVEKVIVKTMEVAYVQGKGRKFVPILFPPVVIPIIEWLSKKCDSFVFENEVKQFIRGHDAVRKMAEMAGTSTKLMSSTRFRKLAATTLQVSQISSSFFDLISSTRHFSSMLYCQ